jgi:3-oxoacyl-[acyl-carrier protein] reductase
MDLGISGRNAIVCGSSRGLGKACAQALANEGVNVWITARTESTLLEAAEDIRATGSGDVHTVAADVTSEQGRDAVFAACPAPDILVNNAGGPPPGDFRDWGQQDWFDAVNANMYSAIDMIRRCLDGMIERRFGRIVNITSNSVKRPVPELGLSNGARSGLTGFVAGIAHEPARHNVTINNLLPGLFATDRLRSLMATRAQAEGRDPDEYFAAYFAGLPPGRPGDPNEFGAACAFLCSEQAAYFTAQNILIDGGVYPATF